LQPPSPATTNDAVLSLWPHGVIALVALAVVVLLLFARRQRVARQAWSAGWNQCVVLYQHIVGTLWLLRCLLYVIWWGINAPVRRAVTNTAVGVMVIATLFFVFEAGMLLFSEQLVEHLVPIWVKFVVVGLGVVALAHRWDEWKRTKERSIFTSGIRYILRELVALRFPDNANERRAMLDDFITKVLSAFHAIFEKRASPGLNLMLPDEHTRLRVSHVFPAGKQYDPNLSLEPGCGAAGMAFSTVQTVYVPAIRYRHGLRVTYDRSPVAPFGPRIPDFELAGNVYEPCSVEPYRCVLSVPIIGIDGAALGVLNFDSFRRNAFNEVDLDMADVAAVALAMLIERYNARP
jgi:hypothetical protein